jgi:hypothetical protein
MEHITLKNQKVVGFENNLPVSIRGLISINSVPAIRNGKRKSAHLVLVDAKLSGGRPEACAIESESPALYLRNVTASGYQAVLNDKGKVVPGNKITEYVAGEVHTMAGSPKKHLGLPIEVAPAAFYEPVGNWVTPDASADDDTEAIQKAIDSGAKTIYFKHKTEYRITDTIHIRGKIRRIVGMRGKILGRAQHFADRSKPLVRFDGKGTHPVVVDRMLVVSYPKTCQRGLELATSQTVVLKSCSLRGCLIVNTPVAKGKVFLEDTHSGLRLTSPQRVWARHYNTENVGRWKKDPVPEEVLNRVYIKNYGGHVWILGMKCEGPAIHCETYKGGKTEILGGFFRDHFRRPDRPYFRTVDASISASYLQYAHAPGKARSLQAERTRNGVKEELNLEPDGLVVGLYSAH